MVISYRSACCYGELREEKRASRGPGLRDLRGKQGSKPGNEVVTEGLCVHIGHQF